MRDAFEDRAGGLDDVDPFDDRGRGGSDAQRDKRNESRRDDEVSASAAATASVASDCSKQQKSPSQCIPPLHAGPLRLGREALHRSHDFRRAVDALRPASLLVLRHRSLHERDLEEGMP